MEGRLPLAIAIQHHANYAWESLPYRVQQMRPVHLGHPQVRDHNIERLGLQHLERPFPAACKGHLPMLALRAQQPLQAVQQPRFVVYKEDACHP
jgi:hypothetical protein